jgi:conserved oligomeric Golgi complex subunit 4
MPPASQLKSTAELTAALGDLQSAEAQVNASLTALLENVQPINDTLRRLSTLAPKLDAISDEATVLNDNVVKTAKTADRVGSRVRALDEEMRRVREASERVGMVMDLKVCTFVVRMTIILMDISSPHYLSYTTPLTHKNGRQLLGIALELWRSQIT